MTDPSPASTDDGRSRASQRRRGRRRRATRRRGGADRRPSATLAHEAGVEIKARSQWAYARIRFFRHRLAVASLIVLIPFSLVGIFAEQLAPYGYDEIDLYTSITGSTRRRSRTTCSARTSSAATT